MKGYFILLITITIVIINLINGYNCSSSGDNKFNNNNNRKSLLFNSESKLLQLLRTYSVNQPKASPRQLDFLADPSLLVTILHSLEIAYWSLPLGFVLMPLINFFRVPNKRRMSLSSVLSPSSPRSSSSSLTQPLSSLLQSTDLNESKLNDMLIRFNDVIKRLSQSSSSNVWSSKLSSSSPSLNLPETKSSTINSNQKGELISHLRNNFTR